jgi:Phospholipid N-methyltransferase
MKQSSSADKTRKFSYDRFWDSIRLEAGFVKEFACSPFHVGSICPSSRALAAQLVNMAQSAAQAASSGLIIDLGAGSGPVTGELLRTGVAPERIVAVERSSSFVRTFQHRYRNVSILAGDAANLRQMLAESHPGASISAIISSLPFRTIPQKIAARIIRELHATLLEHGGVLVQYSYVWWQKNTLSKAGFAPHMSKLVLQNVPPARVESYTVAPSLRPKLML